jgi:spore coat protein H
MSSASLPSRRIQIDPAWWEAIHRDPWDDREADVLIDGKIAAKLKIRGGHTRGYPKPSYELRVVNGHTFHWNAEYDDPSLIRNALSFYFFNLIGLPAPKTTHCRLYVNDRPLGVYLEIEAVVPAFFRERKIRYRSIIYAANDSAHFGLISPESGSPKRSLFEGYELVAGGTAARERLEAFIRDLNRLKGAALKRLLARRLDIDQYLKWLAGAVLTGNFDGFEQNYALYEHLPSGKYRILPWDYEGSWGRNCYGEICPINQVRIMGYNTLTAKLLGFREYREKYFRLLGRLLSGAFTERRLMPVVRRMTNNIAAAVRTDDTRKHDYRVFLNEPQLIRRYIRGRRVHVLRELGRLSGSRRTRVRRAEAAARVAAVRRSAARE